MLKPGGIAAEDERRRKRRAFLLALASSAILTFIFILLVWSPAPPPPEATGYLLLELGEGAPVRGEEAPPAPARPESEKPPAPPPQPQPVEKPAAPEPVAKQPQPEPVAQKPQPKPQPKPVSEKPQPKPEPRQVVEKPQPKPRPAPEPAREVQPPAALEEPAKPAVRAPLPKPEPTTAPEAPAPQVVEPLPQQNAPLSPGMRPPEEPTPEPVAQAPMVAKPPLESQPPPASPQPVLTVPSQQQVSAAPGPAPTVPQPVAPATAMTQPAPQPPQAQPVLEPEPPAPAPPAPGAPAFAPAPPAPSPPLAGGEPAQMPPSPAVSPQAGRQQGGAVGPGEKPYRLKRLRPLLVSIDNANAAFPQWGLEWAVQVHEVPMEGGVTRLLVRYEGGERGRIGPVRSARPYILELARSMGAVLLHVGGSPAALAMIEKEGLTTFDGLYDPLFKRESSRRPPHNTFVNGPEVRKQLSRLRLERARVLSGKAYRPAADSEPGERVEVRYAPDYASAFRYDGKGYSWYRNGILTGVRVTAVVVLRVDAKVIDDVGRLRLSLTRGKGELYLEGKRVPIEWSFDGALTLTDAAGNPVDLTPYRTWFLWVPPWAKVF